ncbi:hypothetical protein GT347_15050 [Xylophilus rhododendri]|uniref:Tetratricopeptide repeat protein n=1 Tax=Xylophilus rhododendri TaxID=2697032 RepID=A0A857J8U2_9BURK|nr:hypothetical protein [Xylophilus rhododendri]QHI99178.1 hypothetical protein GT347_15050 [Xylophilus rhododendri]
MAYDAMCFLFSSKLSARHRDNCQVFTFQGTSMTSPQFDDLMAEALRRMAQGDTENADAALQKAGSLRAADGLPHFLLGANAAQAGDTERAQEEFRAALLLSPTLDIARFQLGLLQATGGHYHDALQTWAPFLNAQPQTYLAHFAWALRALFLGDAAQAGRYLQSGLEMNTENAPLNADMVNLARRLEALGHGESGQAESASAFLISSYRSA